MTPSFEKVDPDERHFRKIEAPEFRHTLTREQLSKVDDITGERWKLDNIISQKIDWLVKNYVEVHNALYDLETEVIRSKKFRQWLWLRITFAAALAVALAKFAGWL